MFEFDMWEPLEQEPYNFRLSEVYEYLHPHMINSKGNVCGIEQSLSPAGLAYRRDLAKKYLGTDDPEELEKMMPTWEAFIQKGKEVYEKSNGEVYMWFSLEDIRQFTQEQSDMVWVNDGKINVENVFGRSLSLVTRFRNEHISDNLITWTPAWNEALREDRHIFTACATWSVKFSIESSDPQQKNLGRWGLMSAPEGNANWGGTSMGITKTCKDKRLAWEFLKFATLSTEAVLSKMCGEEVQIQGAGRTDAGVHAKEQVANVHLKEQVDPQEVKQYLNRYLPEDIAVSEVREVPERFHSRLNATGKIYVYRIATGEVKKVFERRYIYDFGEKPDMELMCRAAEILTGTHDFKSFCANRRMKKSTVRTIYSIDLKEKEGEIVITYTGNGFLHHMIRILTGTLLEVGMKKRSLSSVAELLEVRDREKAGFTAPAKGLTLEKVLYSPLQKESETL